MAKKTQRVRLQKEAHGASKFRWKDTNSFCGEYTVKNCLPEHVINNIINQEPQTFK